MKIGVGLIFVSLLLLSVGFIAGVYIGGVRNLPLSNVSELSSVRNKTGVLLVDFQDRPLLYYALHNTDVMPLPQLIQSTAAAVAHDVRLTTSPVQIATLDEYKNTDQRSWVVYVNGVVIQPFESLTDVLIYPSDIVELQYEAPVPVTTSDEQSTSTSTILE